jgi:glycosyltransferase involved in cell wall biosynthesis
MKILLGVLYYEPAWAYGGPPRMVFDVARELVKRGHQVTVCTTDALDQGSRIDKRLETSHGVEVVRFPNLSNWLAFHVKIFLPLGMRAWLETQVGRFDVVHLFDARTLQNAWASKAAARRGVPFVVSVWGSLPRGDGWRGLVKGRYDRKHLPTQLGRAAALLAQNAHEAALYAEYGGDPRRVQLWPLAVDPAEYANLPKRGGFRAKHGIGADEPMVLFVGRLTALKGLDALLRIFAEANRRVPAARLVVVGRDDGHQAQMQALAQKLALGDRFVFVGPLYGQEVLPAYVDADLFCITPTHFEETSLAALSACACARPVLINDRCGIPWLEDYQGGRCVSHDESALASALGELLSDRPRLDEMGKNARRMIEERFFLPQIVGQLESIYGAAVQARTGGLAA